MTRGTRPSPSLVPLPKVSFEKIEDEVTTQPGGVHDQQARSYGYNDFSEFRRPEHYIRHIEPLESDLARQVEYDMDEQDQEWLDAINVERKKEQLDKVSYEVFEIIMDRLEKEWFDLTKNLPKPDLAMPSEDSTCAICDDSEGENSNAIVFCDGCNLAVHQDCYGVPYIPEGQWLCRKCTVSPENPVQCILCPNEGGAFKQTLHGEWVHLLCAMWVPETRVANEVFMEPIIGVDKISKQRWKLKCSICDIREGACIQCAKTSCFLAFHATCARKEKFLLPMKSTQGSEPVTLTCYCERHLPEEQGDARAAALAAEESHNPNSSPNYISKSARAYAKTYKPGPPLVPALIVNRILSYIGKVVMRKKSEFLLMVCRYWSLKREARRGAPLLKRLHLEPWTANAGGRLQSEEQKQMKLTMLKCLRDDLERLRVMAELSRKRETRKFRQSEILHNILATALFPHEEALRSAFERITNYDRNDYFKNPVSKNDVPDYFDIVQNPMCWAIIDEKLEKHEYWDKQSFKDDINLVVDNAILYNKPNTAFYKTALRIKAAAETILQELDAIPGPHRNVESNQDAMDVVEPENQVPPIGDLEPPLDVLELLVSSDAIKDDLKLKLSHDPLVSLFSYELAKMKPPPPPPPPKPRKPKRDRKAEYERFKARKEAEAAAAAMASGIEGANFKEQATQASLDTSPGFRAPRTRGAIAAVTAFEAEAQTQPTSYENLQSGNVAGAKRKRGLSNGPTQPPGPQMVSHVDNRESFTRFDIGWILPPEQKRGGRPTMEKPLIPMVNKKRSRTDASTSQLSSYSTPALDNQTLRQSSTGEGIDNVAETQNMAGTTLQFDADTGPFITLKEKVADVYSPLLNQDDLIPPGTIIEQPNGTIVIEELDTPAIRRQKNLRRKAAKERLAISESLAQNNDPSSITPRIPVSSGVSHIRANLEAESDLSSLSELGSEKHDKIAGTLGHSAPDKEHPVQKSSYPGQAQRDAAESPAEDTLVNGTLVWAKALSYPWWPATIREADNPLVPDVILKKRQQTRLKRKVPLHIIQFYDKNETWQCLPVEKLKLLGEDKALDDELLGQKYRSDMERDECREAFMNAMGEIELSSTYDAFIQPKVSEDLPLTS